MFFHSATQIASLEFHLRGLVVELGKLVIFNDLKNTDIEDRKIVLICMLKGEVVLIQLFFI